MTAPAGAAPFIGLTGRRGVGSMIGAPYGFVDAPLDIYLSEYAASVITAGGLPVHLPMSASPELLATRLDGIIIAGGEDVDPRLYGQAPAPLTGPVDPIRDAFELGLIRAGLAHGIPVLGVCRGLQLINVALGGTLIQHLESGTGESHGSYAYPRAHRVHDIAIERGSQMHGIYGDTVRTNSFHHQAVDAPGDGVAVVGRAADGVVEAIEAPDRNIVGVQWHPETLGGDPVFGWLVTQAHSYRNRHQLQGAA